MAQAAILVYRDSRRKPGGFLTAVLSNNLLVAVSSGDPETLKNLKAIVLFAYEALPDAIYGTPDKVAAHIAGNTNSPNQRP